jgi:uncharacterized protein YecT (DUF1311 family)
MKTIPTIFLLVTLAASALAEDESPVDVREVELERLVDQAPKLHIQNLLDYNLEKLETVYRAALESADDDDHRKALQNSQEAWLKFYAADGFVANWNAKGGSMEREAQIQQKIYQLRTRIYQLSTPFLQGWQTVPRIQIMKKQNKPEMATPRKPSD